MKKINKPFIIRIMYINKLLFIVTLLVPFLGEALNKTAHFTLKDNTQVVVQPITSNPKDKASMYQILKDPDTCKTMRDGLPWPDVYIDSTYAYYVAAWQTYNDLESMGVTDHNLTFAFVIHTTDGRAVGLGGIQNSTRGDPYKEIYFELLPPYRRKGLGQKFAKFLISAHKSIYGNRMIEAVVVPENTASKGLLKKIGFKPKIGKDGKIATHRFPKYGNRMYEIFQYKPSAQT